MLRHCAKRAIYILTIFLSGCSVRPLLNSSNSVSYNVDVQAPDISIKHYFYNSFTRKIRCNSKILNNISIKINLSYDSDLVAFNNNGVAAEDIKLIAKVSLIDKNTLQPLHEFLATEYASFSVSDDQPFASINSKKSAMYAVIDTITTTIAENIHVFIQSR